MATSLTFPLSSKYLPKVELTSRETEAYRTAANEIVVKTLEQELAFRYERKCTFDENEWKFVKAKDRLNVYKRAAPTSAERSAVPMVVAVGKIDGRMEDALYGVHHKTTDEMRIATSFLNKNHLDAAVLHTIESGTDKDPFRYLGIKWRIAETPGGNLIRNRDVCVLEFVGTSVDALGQKFGFHVIKSIDAPWFPELPDPRIVRARMMLCCIYRQLEPTVVDSYMKGVFDLGGELMDMIAYNTAADKLLGIAKTVDCAEAKQLTLYLVLQQKQRLEKFTTRSSSALSIASDTLSNRSSSARSVASDVFSVRSTSTDDDDSVISDDDAVGNEKICSVCRKKRSALSLKWVRCRICCGLACSKCHERKTIFARPKHMKVSCCTPCIAAAKDLPVDPRDPYPIIDTMRSS